MKKIISSTIVFILIATISITLAAFNKVDFSNKSEGCGEWQGAGILYRSCENSAGLKTHQFKNRYRFEVRFNYSLEYVNGTNSTGNITLDSEEVSYNAANDNSSGVNNKVKTWKIIKKEKKNSEGKWEEFY